LKPGFHAAKSIKLRILDNTSTLRVRTGVSNQHFVFAIQDGLHKWNGIPAASQDLSLEVHFLAGKIIRAVRNVMMKLSEKYPYREMYEQSCSKKDPKSRLAPLFVFKSGLEKPIPTPYFMK